MSRTAKGRPWILKFARAGQCCRRPEGRGLLRTEETLVAAAALEERQGQ